jgi:hypothetical protein
MTERKHVPPPGGYHKQADRDEWFYPWLHTSAHVWPLGSDDDRVTSEDIDAADIESMHCEYGVPIGYDEDDGSKK